MVMMPKTKHVNKLLLPGGRELSFEQRTLVMGILNVTPDSFSDGGRFNQEDEAIRHAKEMIKQGVDIIDIGGESTRPGSDFIPLDVEIERVVPAIKAIRSFSDIPISIDTYKAKTADRALEAGADIINDVWGGKADADMMNVAAKWDVPIILMHNRDNKDYNDLIEDMRNDLQESIDMAKAAGIPDHHIVLDPGIGFAKTYDDNLWVMNQLERFTDMDYPVLLGTSRKSFIGKTLDQTVDDRMEGTGATVCLGITKGCQIVRVHDVGPIKKMVNMMDAMVKKV